MQLEKSLEIIKVENHYEIKEIKKKSNNTEINSTNDEINFYDSAAGIRFYKSLKGIQNKSTFVGTVVIKLINIDSTAIIDFINEIFSDKSLSYNTDYYRKIIITIKDYNMPKKEDIADLLDRCILLNTYLAHYFMEVGTIDDYNIFYGVHNKDNKLDCLCNNNEFSYNTQCSLIINELVKINTEANQKIGNNDYISRDKLNYSVYKYNYIFSKLAENLKKIN